MYDEEKNTMMESIITKMVWRFRGGWTFGCAGKDTRTLSQAARRSLAKRAEDSSKSFTKLQISRLNADIDNIYARLAALESK